MGVTIRVENLNKVTRNLQKLGTDAQDLKDVMRGVAEKIIIPVARAKARRRTGAMAGSIRSGNAKNKAIVRAGAGLKRYVPIQHYGNPHHSISPNPFLVDAISGQQDRIYKEMEQGINQLIKRSGF